MNALQIKTVSIVLAVLFSTTLPLQLKCQEETAAGKGQVVVHVNWDHVIRESKTNATLQAVVTPLMGPDSPWHDQVWSALRNMDARFVRYVPWLPYPKLAVAELQPPANGKTSWNFSLIDPYTDAFFAANPERPVIINFSTIPAWMFKTDHPVTYPSDPDKPVWTYTQGTELRDPSMKELGDYYARLVSWYTKGGFTDEYGKWHQSGHHFKFDYWEVLNEVDSEHHTTPQQYTARYDAIVSAIRRVQPNMKFVGLALADTQAGEPYFEYFLNHAHHKPGIPLDMISYHFYAFPKINQPVDTWGYTVFEQSERFVQTVEYVEAIRRNLSPNTQTTIDEIGVVAPQDDLQGARGYTFKPFPSFYWNLCAAQFAYLYGELSRLGIDAVGESALMQVPGFFASVSMMNWEDGKPNARYWALKLLRDNFGPGDKIVSVPSIVGSTVAAYAVVTRSGKRKLLLVNLRNKPADVVLPGMAGAEEQYVDQSTGEDPPPSVHLTSGTVRLGGYAVSVLTLQ